MIIIDEEFKYGISWDILEREGNNFFGTVNFIINGEIVPKGANFNTTINVVFHYLKLSMKSEDEGEELGEIEVDYTKLDYGVNPNIYPIETAELEMVFGGDVENIGRYITQYIGYSGNEERLFYRLDPDDALSYIEVRLPKGTVRKVIGSLPLSIEELEHQFDNTAIKVV